MANNGISLATTDLIVNISSQYPAVYTFLLLVSALVGFVACGYVLMLLVQVKVFHTVPPDQFNWGLAVPALLIGAMMISFPSTMTMTTETLLGQGYGSLMPPTAIAGGVSAVALLGMFAEQTSRVLGWIIGFWGLANIYFSRLPNGERNQLWSGLIRLSLGSAMVSVRALGNLFGGMGDRIFG